VGLPQLNALMPEVMPRSVSAALTTLSDRTTPATTTDASACSTVGPDSSEAVAFRRTAAAALSVLASMRPHNAFYPSDLLSTQGVVMRGPLHAALERALRMGEGVKATPLPPLTGFLRDPLVGCIACGTSRPTAQKTLEPPSDALGDWLCMQVP
jgi:hypothetical protein